MTPQELALRHAVLKVLVAELSTAKKVADCEVRDTWRPGDRLTAVLPDGPDLGTVTLAKGRASAKLADETAYEAWVKQNHPGEIETVTVTRINPDFTARLLSAARQLGVAVDAETGEEVPGITIEAGDPYPMVKLATGAAEAVGAAWRAGQLGELLGGLLAIGGDDAASS